MELVYDSTKKQSISDVTKLSLADIQYLLEANVELIEYIEELKLGYDSISIIENYKNIVNELLHKASVEISAYQAYQLSHKTIKI